MDIDLGQLTWPCDCGKEHEIRIRELRIEAGAVSMLDEILMENQYQNPVFICDSNSGAAA
jgi:glycerol-1-phosphate dehydrogenase [NAD(P)+]